MAGGSFESYKPTYHDTDAVYGLPNEQVSLLSTGLLATISKPCRMLLSVFVHCLPK